MTNKEYTKAVESEQYPADPSVPLGSKFEDERGVIQNLLLTPLNSIGIIESKAGTIRSQHYHKIGSHYLYVLSGRMEYSERYINGSNVVHRIVGPGEMIFTGPQRIHITKFIEDTVLLSMSKASKEHEDHEADLVRVKF